jgi:hypothetical protein
MDNHNVLLCERIASSMGHPDETKKLIVEKILARGQAEPQASLPLAKIRALGANRKARRPSVTS